MTKYNLKTRKQRGFIVSYVIVGLALLSAFITVSGKFYTDSRLQRLINESRDEALSQAELIRDRIYLCTIAYPQSDNGSGVAELLKYPAQPASNLVEDIECPGAPGPDQRIFGGYDSSILPPPPVGGQQWEYILDIPNRRIQITLVLDSRIGEQVAQSLRRRLGTNNVSLVGNRLSYNIVELP